MIYSRYFIVLSVAGVVVTPISAQLPTNVPERELVEWINVRIKTAFDLGRSFCPLISESDAAIAKSDTLAMFATATANRHHFNTSFAARMLNIQQLEAWLENDPNNSEIKYRIASQKYAMSGLFSEGPDQFNLRLRMKVLEESQQLIEDEPTRVKHRVLYASTAAMLADQLDLEGQHAEAARKYETAIEQWKQAMTHGGEKATYRVGLAYAYNGSGGTNFANREFDKARKLYEQALEIRLKLAEEFPSQSIRLVEVGGSICNIGNVIVDGERKYPEALKYFDRAVAVLDKALKADANVPNGRDYLVNSHQGRFIALVRQKKFAEADRAFETGISLLPPGAAKPRRIGRCLELAENGEHIKAVDELERILANEKLESNLIFHVVTVFAAASQSAKEDAKLTESYAKQAMKNLQAMRQQGAFLDKQTIKDVETHPDLRPLSKREDFQRFFKEVTEEAEKLKDKI